jgi:hypothetical protein
MAWRAHVTSIGLTVAAAGALAYAYTDRGSVTEAEKKTREGSVFVAWRREDLARITLDHDGEHIVLERVKDDAGDAEWWMRAPLDEKADPETSGKLAAAFEFAAVSRKVEGDVKVPGLDAPRARGEIVMGPLTYRFALGGDAPTPAGAAYLRVEGGGAGGGTVVVSHDLVLALLQGKDTYRSRNFVPYVSVQLAELDVKGEADLRLARADDVSFKLVPSGLRASRAKLDAVWGALGDMRAEAFVSDDVAAPLVATPKATIMMTPIAGSPGVGTAGAVPGVIRVGGECPGNPDDVVVVRDAPTRLSACAPKGILSGLATTAAALEDAHLFAAHDDEVAELRIEALPPSNVAGAAIELARKESGWREKAPAERDLPEEEATAATALVATVAGAEGTGPHKDDSPFEPKWRVTLQRANRGAVEVVEVGAPDAAGDVIARRTFDGARLHVGAAVARKLMPRAVALRGPEVWAPRIEGVPVALIETRCDGIEQTVSHDGDTWTMRVPSGSFAVDNSSVLDLVDAVTRARADSWVADADDGHFGFDGPQCVVAMTLRGGEDAGARERGVRLEIGRAGEGGVYARTGDSAAVFVGSAALRERASAWLVDLHGFSLPNLYAVTLQREGKRLEFTADDPGKPAAEDAGDRDTAEAVLAAANVLRADAAVHLGPARPEEGLAAPSLVLTERAGGTTRRVTFGAASADGKTRYARVDGIDATYVVGRDRTRAFFDRF